MFRRRLTRALAFTAATSLVVTAVALADSQTVDNDLAAAGLQNTVSLTATAGATVNTSAQLVIERSGRNHLPDGEKVTLAVATTQTTLPDAPAYSVSSVELTIPSPWDTNGQTVAGTSSITFAAPATPGSYTYTVKWAPTKDFGNQLTGGPAFTIDLTVEEPQGCDYTASFLRPIDESTDSGLVGNTFKKGRVVPIKAIVRCDGAPITGDNSDLIPTISVENVGFLAVANDTVESYSDAGSSSSGTQAFRWVADSGASAADGGGYWIYNLDSSKGFQVGTSYRVSVNIDGTRIDDTFAILVPQK